MSELIIIYKILLLHKPTLFEAADNDKPVQEDRLVQWVFSSLPGDHRSDQVIRHVIVKMEKQQESLEKVEIVCHICQ